MSMSPSSSPVSRRVLAAVFLYSLCLLLYELLLTRLFAVVLFASFAHLALALALLGTGVGAVAQHLWPSLVPERGLLRRLGWIGLGLGVSTVFAVLAVLHFPVLQIPEGLLTTYQDTSANKAELLHQGWFAALLPVLAVPFAFAGLAFAGVFQRLRQHIGVLYGADLVGGALAAVLFLPVLSVLAGPDVAFVVAALAGVGAVISFGADRSDRLGMGLSVALIAGSVALSVAGLSGDVLKVVRTVGFSEDRVTYTEWTPLVRLAVHETKEETLVLLDNTSASAVPMSEADLKRLTVQANRRLAYDVIEPSGKVAILAASAGPEVAVARSAGFTDIEAIDLESAIFRVVAERFAGSPVNPYADGTVRRVHLDARAAILSSPDKYRLIQMVHANLWSAAGLLANTWSPALLETRDAFGTYLDHLEPDGVISFGRGSQTEALARSASAALSARGVDKPWQAVAWVTGRSQVILVRPRAWTPEERAQLVAALPGYSQAALAWPIDQESAPKAWKKLMSERAMTDDRPYVDTWSDVRRIFGKAADLATPLGPSASAEDDPLATIYLSVFVQFAFVFAAGGVFVALPWALRGRTEVRGVVGTGRLLAYVACLGYGYLALETVLIHQLVLFVGHPTYAITIVVLAMLLGSGLGSVFLAGDSAGEGIVAARRLRKVLFGVLGLGLVCGVFAPPALAAVALGAPIAVRAALTFVVIFPLGFIMGAPFPLALRSVGATAAPAIPWAWAINGWMSVLASLATVVIARLYGYTFAYGVALAAYGVAAVLAVGLARVGAKAEPRAEAA
ncbi:MAG: hypothetical protein Q8P18_12115 [Pseudomonadota bacterium]|nr:hypothetical protein [Pseudomonadota bacterium]